jgi:hypothetical protein
VNGDRGSSGQRSEAPGQPAEEPEHQGDRGGDQSDPHDPGQENALDKRENSQEEALTGVIGGFETRDRVFREETEPENHIRDTDDQEGGFRTMNKPSTYDEWKARSARENLDTLGWARVRTFVPRRHVESTKLAAEEHPVLDDDPVARMLTSWLWLGDGSTMTTRRLFKLRAKDKSKEELRSMDWPTDPQKMQERLELVVPFLQGEHPLREGYSPRRDRFMHFEYWAKGSTGEGLWVLIPAHEGGPTEEEVEEKVWEYVRHIEGIGRPNPFWTMIHE